jgi:hypothetical protein
VLDAFEGGLQAARNLLAPAEAAEAAGPPDDDRLDVR